MFSSRTTTVNWLVALSDGVPLSVTFTTTTFVDGPCDSVGVQATWPDGLTVNPTGPPTSPKLNELAGKSASVADKVSDSGAPSFTTWLAAANRVGRWFASRTTTVN